MLNGRPPGSFLVKVIWIRPRGGDPGAIPESVPCQINKCYHGQHGDEESICSQAQVCGPVRHPEGWRKRENW